VILSEALKRIQASTAGAWARLQARERARTARQVIVYRAGYWRRKAWTALGICPECGAVLNRTYAGRAICPNKLTH